MARIHQFIGESTVEFRQLAKVHDFVGESISIYWRNDSAPSSINL